MHVVHSLEEISPFISPITLSIGNFDGLHLGHQVVLQHLLKTTKEHGATSAVLTFSNHPSTVLRPSHPTPLLCSIAHKVHLLDQIGIDLAILLPFTPSFSEQPAEAFLRNIKSILPFQHLILGSDAHMGKNRDGDKDRITALSQSLGFSVEYLPDCDLDGTRISSSLIRSHIQKGDFLRAAALLGRPYSIYGEVLKGHGKGASLGFPTANLSVNNLCLPPLGVYAVQVLVDDKTHEGIANLGFAPTMRQEDAPLLEVHLFEHHETLYDKTIDVRFIRFIRPEKRFHSIEELKQQIALDIKAAKFS
jgi:riboflavin kinase/FMN adenylyltransferase